MIHSIKPPAFLALILLACAHPGALVQADLRQDLVGHWTGNLERKNQRYPIRVDIAQQGDTARATLDLPEYCIYGLPAEVRVRGDRVRITSSRIKLDGVLSGRRLTGKSTRFQKVRADFQLQRTDESPVIYHHEPLEFENGSARLAGTLVLPDGEGPFPLVLWTHGSGPDTRETFYYSGRAHLLAQHGIASLIYDKRGAGHSTGEAAWKLENLVGDAVAGVRAVKQHPKINPDAIGVAGFSQGGWVAPLSASREDDIAFILVGATPGVSGAEQNIFSALSRLERDGFSEEQVNSAGRFLRSLYAFYATGEGRAEVLDLLNGARGTSWFKSRWVSNVTFLDEEGELREGKYPGWESFAADPSAYWSSIQVPVLSIWGSEDIDVPAEKSKHVLESALTSAGNSDFTLKIIPNASHGLWDESKTDGWDWDRQAMAAHQLLVDWAVEHTRRESEQR